MGPCTLGPHALKEEKPSYPARNRAKVDAKLQDDARTATRLRNPNTSCFMEALMFNRRNFMSGMAAGLVGIKWGLRGFFDRCASSCRAHPELKPLSTANATSILEELATTA